MEADAGRQWQAVTSTALGMLSDISAAPEALPRVAWSIGGLLAITLAVAMTSVPIVRAQSGQSAARSDCPNCGVVRSVREVDSDRPTQAADPRPSAAGDPGGDFPGSLGGSFPIAWVASANYAGGEGLSKGYVGAVGSPEMRQSLAEKSFEIVVLLENGRYQLIREDQPPVWQPGDRVKIVMGKIVPAQ
jgi:hypothetical protein